MDPITAGAIASAGGLALSHLSNQASLKEASDNRDFQERMSNTAHQRQVLDLKAAGLNPILSAGGSGASTPTGGQGSIADLGAHISKGMDTAIAVKAQKKEFEHKDADIGNINEDTMNKRAQKALIENQSSATAKDIEQKALQNHLLKQTIPSAIKKAKAEGDYSEVNQILGIIQSGTSSAGNILDITAPFKKSIMKTIKGKKP